MHEVINKYNFIKIKRKVKRLSHEKVIFKELSDPFITHHIKFLIYYIAHY